MLLSTVLKTSKLESVLQLIFALAIFLLVLFLAWVAARVAGSYQNNVLLKRGNKHIVETMRIANDKYIQIVKLADRYVALSVTKDHIELLLELDPDSVNEQADTTASPADFKTMFSKALRKDKHEDSTTKEDLKGKDEQ